ncbi:hypothetical protein LINPERHAP2_LOCUS12577 [Linum perenne]
MSVVVGATSGQSSGEIKASLRVSVDSASKARFMTHRKESISTHQLGCPLIDYMSLPANQCYLLICPIFLVKAGESAEHGG